MNSEEHSIEDPSNENLLQKDLVNSMTVSAPLHPGNTSSNGEFSQGLSGELETPFERKKRKNSHLVVYFTTFIVSIGFSVIMTGVWPYLRTLDPSASKEFLGWVVASTSLGQMVASPFLAWCGSKMGSNRGSFVVTIIMFIIGNLLYGLLPLFGYEGKYVMLGSRFIIGISSANIAVCRSYISSSTKVNERTLALSIVAAAQSMGFILGPSIQTALTYIFEKGVEGYSNSTSLNHTVSEENTSAATDTFSNIFNMYSLTGWLTAVLGFINLFFFLPCVYQEVNIAACEEKRQTNGDSLGINKYRTKYFALCITLFGYFVFLLIFVLIETIIVPMCLDLYAWTPEFAVKVVGIGLTIAGVITVFTFILSGKLAKVFGDRKVFIVCGVMPLMFSMLIFLPVYGDTPKIKQCPSTSQTANTSSVNLSFPLIKSSFPLIKSSNEVIKNSTLALNESLARIRRSALNLDDSDCDDLGCPASQEWCFYTPVIQLPQLVVACLLTTVGYSACVSLTGAIFSKMLKVKEQGLWMGILTSAGSLSRAVGPIFVTYIYTAKGPLWTFGILFVTQLVVLILNIVFYNHMSPILNISESSTLS